MRKRKETTYDKVDGRLQKVTKTVSAVVALTTVATGIFTYVSDRFTNAISKQINELRAEIQETDREQTLTITRLELLSLMRSDPDNKVAILKTAKHYFVDLGGDTWMSEKYSQFAEEHGLDASFVVK